MSFAVYAQVLPSWERTDNLMSVHNTKAEAEAALASLLLQAATVAAWIEE